MPSGVTSASFNLIVSIVGTGILSYPIAFSDCGILWSFLLLCVCTCFSYISLKLLIIASDALKKKFPDDHDDLKPGYPTLAIMAGGRGLALFTQIIVTISLFGSANSRILGAAQIIVNLYSSNAGVTDSDQLNVIKMVTIITFTVAIIFPLGLMRSMSSLRFTSILSVICSIFLTLCLFVEYFHCSSSDAICFWNFNRQQINEYIIPSISFQDILNTIPIFIFGYNCHPSVFPIYKALVEDSDGKSDSSSMSLVFKCALTVSFTLYTIAGSCGFLLLLDETPGNILEQSYPGRVHMTIAKVLFAVAMILAVPTFVNALRETCLEMVKIYRAEMTNDNQIIVKNSSSMHSTNKDDKVLVESTSTDGISPTTNDFNVNSNGHYDVNGTNIVDAVNTIKPVETVVISPGTKSSDHEQKPILTPGTPSNSTSNSSDSPPPTSPLIISLTELKKTITTMTSVSPSSTSISKSSSIEIDSRLRLCKSLRQPSTPHPLVTLDKESTIESLRLCSGNVRQFSVDSLRRLTSLRTLSHQRSGGGKYTKTSSNDEDDDEKVMESGSGGLGLGVEITTGIPKTRSMMPLKSIVESEEEGDEDEEGDDEGEDVDDTDDKNETDSLVKTDDKSKLSINGKMDSLFAGKLNVRPLPSADNMLREEVEVEFEEGADAKTQDKVTDENEIRLSTFWHVIVSVIICVVLASPAIFVNRIDEVFRVLGCTSNPISGYILPTCFVLMLVPSGEQRLMKAIAIVMSLVVGAVSVSALYQQIRYLSGI